jgi:hypothetical protein
MSKPFKPILCLDFDGVIHSYTSGWKGAAVIPDPPVLGALEFIVTALERFEVHILSSRSHQWGGRRAMKRWLRAQLYSLGMAEDAVHIPQWWADKIFEAGRMDPWHVAVLDAADGVIQQIKWPWFKPPAMVTIDDRALTFTGAWPALADLQGFKPWNKKAV